MDKQITVKFDADVLDRVKARALREGNRGASSVIREIVERELAKSTPSTEAGRDAS